MPKNHENILTEHLNIHVVTDAVGNRSIKKVKALFPMTHEDRAKRLERVTWVVGKMPSSESKLLLDAYLHRLSCAVNAPGLRIDDRA
jgi:hypothetical protein